jgi:integrase
VFPLYTNWDRYQKKLFERTGTSGWHRHDLRRTGATTLGGLGVAPHVIEACLGHTTLHSSLAGIYNQSRYTNEHADALQLLADYYNKISA